MNQNEEVDKKEDEERILLEKYPLDSKFCSSGPTVIVEITNPFTGNTWMDRNLGAKRAATSRTDEQAFGDLYQWGRRSDGHQCRESGTTTITSFTDKPGHDLFIIPQNNNPSDWKSPSNKNLWQGVNGINNPCPEGFRVPTPAEFLAESKTWPSWNSQGAFNSPLKFVEGGGRTSSGIFNGYGLYWTNANTAANTNWSLILALNPTSLNKNLFDKPRYEAYSVRCIRDKV